MKCTGRYLQQQTVDSTFSCGQEKGLKLSKGILSSCLAYLGKSDFRQFLGRMRMPTQLIHYWFYSCAGRNCDNSGRKRWTAEARLTQGFFFLNKGTVISNFRILEKVLHIVSYWTVLDPIHLLRIFERWALDY